MAPVTESHSDRMIQSVKISFEVINKLETEGSMRVTELANQLDYSVSTIHSHLQTLESLKYVTRDDSGYRLSLQMLRIAGHVRDHVGNYDVIQKEINSLAEEIGETAQFGIEEHGKVSYLCKASEGQAVETASSIGAQQPIYSTGIGKTILAFLPPKRTAEIINSIEFTAYTSNTITTAEGIYEELEQIRERGYGIDDEENITGLRCVAAPVKTEEDILGAVSISGPKSRFTDDRIHDELPEFVTGAANVIELNTQFS